MIFGINTTCDTVKPVLSRHHIKRTPSFNPFASGDFTEKRVLKLVELFSGHCHAIKS